MADKYFLGKGGGGHDDRQEHLSGINMLEQFDPGHFRHQIIGDQQIVGACLQCFPSDRAIFGTVYLIAGISQCFDIELSDQRLIIHHEDAPARRARFPRQSGGSPAQCRRVLIGNHDAIINRDVPGGNKVFTPWRL